MTGCWSQGELRAWLDRELPSRDIELVAAHIKECAECREVCDVVSSRAARVGALLDSLPEMSGPGKLPQIARGARPLWPVTAAAGIAAALAVTLLAPWQHAPLPQPKAPQAVSKAAPSQAVPKPPPMQVKPAIIRKRVPAKPKPRLEDYVALDNDPIETGVVVRVNLDTGVNGAQIPADVIVGPDGRARAIRLVTDFPGER